MHLPLIVASILSKKLAEGIDGLVLDVKVGRGAFMKDEDRGARAGRGAGWRVGTRAGKKVVALLTRMDTPLGVAVGNANETKEAIDVLHGGGPSDVIECTMALGAEMVVLGGRAKTLAEGRAMLAKAIASGDGARVFERMIAAQGATRAWSATRRGSRSPRSRSTFARPGRVLVEAIDALAIGLAAVAMGAGARARTRRWTLRSVSR